MSATAVGERKRRAAESAEDLAVNINSEPKRSSRMEEGGNCTRCDASLCGLLLRCAKCHRTFHNACRATDERAPVEDKGKVEWSCRVCSLPASRLSSDGIMSVLDKTSFGDEQSQFIAYLVTRVRALEEQVAMLTAKSANQHLGVINATAVGPATESADPQASAPRSGDPSKSVLVIGDNVVAPLRPALREILPADSSVSVRTAPKSNIESILEVADVAISKAKGAVCLFLQAGYHECMEFEKDKYVSAVSSFATKLKESRPGSEMHVLSIPLFGQDCKAANDELARIAGTDGAPFSFIQLTIIQRPVVESGRFSYRGETAGRVAYHIARRVKPFLDVRLKKIKKHVVSAASTPRTTIRQRNVSVDRSATQQSQVTFARQRSRQPVSRMPSQAQHPSQRVKQAANHHHRQTQQRTPPPTMEDFVIQALAALESLNRPQMDRGRKQDSSQHRQQSRSASRGRWRSRSRR